MPQKSTKTIQATTEQIENPDRYTRNGISVWDIEKMFDDKSLTGFENHLRNAVTEYLLRFPQKNGIEDLEKCKVVIDRLISELRSRGYKSERQN